MFSVESILAGYLLPMAVRAVAKWGMSTDWELFKGTVKERLPGVLPGEFFDDAGVEIANSFIDAVAGVLSNAACLERLMGYCLAKDFLGAMKYLWDLVTERQ